jgi:hypothetical protein
MKISRWLLNKDTQMNNLPSLLHKRLLHLHRLKLMQKMKKLRLMLFHLRKILVV